MHWKFEPFFSIEILHGKYPPQTGQPAQPAPDFVLVPTDETKSRLSKMGWVFKPRVAGGGGVLYAEKVVAPDQTAKLRVRPANNEGFSFLILLSNPALLQKTKPFDSPASSMPPFSGRARTLYFDNLNANAIGGNIYLLSQNSAVSFAEFASRVPVHFMYRAASNAITSLDLTPLVPGGATSTIPINDNTHSIEVNLPENGYRVAPKPSGNTETLYLSDETFPPATLGVVRIFQPPGADWEPFRRYQIMFDLA